MKLVSVEQMGELERRSAEVGLPAEVLMDNAGLAVAREVERLAGGVEKRSILILIGPGNNGGDGLVAARYLHDWGAQVKLYLSGQRPDGDKNLRLTQERGIPTTEATADAEFSFLEDALSSAEIVIDALFGTGKLRPLRGPVKEVLGRVCQGKTKRPPLTVVALDLPSGLDADSGAEDPACLPADLTITLGYPKAGLFAGSEKVGRVVVADIGIPPELAEDIVTELITPDWVGATLPHRPLTANKGTFGRVMVVAGSINYIGAAYLACAGAVRVGAGLVTLATAQSLQPILASKLTEVTYFPLPEAAPGIIHPDAASLLHDQLPDYQVLLIGCGLGQSPEAVEFVHRALFDLPSPPHLVLDADALNTLARVAGWSSRLPQGAVLTPHPGEMSRLSGLSVAEIQGERLAVAQRSAAQWGQVVVLKGAYTVTASPEGKTMLSPFANPGLASAGTGDVLSGAIAGLLAQGLSPFAAAACGVYLHAAAGEMVKEELGNVGMIASDIPPKLPLVIKQLKGAKP